MQTISELLEKTFVVSVLLISAFTGLFFFLIDSLSLSNNEFIIYNILLYASVFILRRHSGYLIYAPQKVLDILRQRMSINKKLKFINSTTKIYYSIISFLFMVDILILYYLRYLLFSKEMMINEAIILNLNIKFIIAILFFNVAIFPIIKSYFDRKLLHVSSYKGFIAIFIANFFLQIGIIITAIILFILASVVLAVFAVGGITYG